MKIASVKEVYALEEEARKCLNSSSASLMCMASKAIAKYIYRHINARKSLSNIPVVFFAGKGNNGGDAIASALFLTEDYGIQDIIIYSLELPMNFSNEILQYYSKLPKNIKFIQINSANDIIDFPKVAVIVDGLLGIGFQGECRKNIAQIIDFINETGNFTIAIDLPSGLEADSGFGSVIVRADITLVIGIAKRGLYVEKGVDFSGIVEFLDINLDIKNYDDSSQEFNTIIYDEITPYFRRKAANQYKKTAGELLVVAGSKNYKGAAILATQGALAVNCGMLYLAQVTKDNMQLDNSIIFVDCSDSLLDTFSVVNIPKLLEIAERVDTILVGPGLGFSEELKEVLATLFKLDKNFIIDADAINLIAKYPEIWLENQAKKAIFTPHIGEAERLRKAFNIESESRLDLAEKLAVKLGATVVLKGARTIISSASSNEKSTILGVGSYALGKAGSGDVLAGVISALASKNSEFSLFENAKLGAFLHSYSVNYIGSMSSFRIIELPKLIQNIIEEISPF